MTLTRHLAHQQQLLSQTTACPRQNSKTQPQQNPKQRLLSSQAQVVISKSQHQVLLALQCWEYSSDTAHNPAEAQQPLRRLPGPDSCTMHG